jgi:hypothetical protein
MEYGRILTMSSVGTARCAVRAASSGAISDHWRSFRPLLRGRGHRSAMSLPQIGTVSRCTHGIPSGLVPNKRRTQTRQARKCKYEADHIQSAMAAAQPDCFRVWSVTNLLLLGSLDSCCLKVLAFHKLAARNRVETQCKKSQKNGNQKKCVLLHASIGWARFHFFLATTRYPVPP